MKENLWKGKYKPENILSVKIKTMKPFIRRYGHPVIIHAVEDKNIFSKILNEGKIKLPRHHGNQKKSPLMEKFLGVDNSIFLSVGFDYWVNYNFKYNFIFDLGILKESDYYWRPLPLKCYTDIANWWYKNDRDYLFKLRDYSERCREVVDKFIWSIESSSYKNFFEFWKIEKVVFKFILDHPKKATLFKIAKRRLKNLKRKYPYTKTLAKRDWNTNNFPEIIYHKDIDLMNSLYFLGFFIEGEIPASIRKVLREKYSGKIIFDGRVINSIDR